MKADILLTNIGQLVTMDHGNGPVRGKEMNSFTSNRERRNCLERWQNYLYWSNE